MTKENGGGERASSPHRKKLLDKDQASHGRHLMEGISWKASHGRHLMEGISWKASHGRHLMEGLIHRPALTHTVSVRFGGILIQGRKLLHPVEDGGSIYLDVSLGEPLDHLRVAESEAQVPAHRQTDDRGRKGMTRKGSTGEGGKGAAAVRATVDLRAPPVTAVLENILFLTMRTELL